LIEFKKTAALSHAIVRGRFSQARSGGRRATQEPSDI